MAKVDPFTPSKDPNTNWENDAIQFARLLAEANSLGLFDRTALAALGEAMDLTALQVDSIVDRAETRWQKIKKQTRT